MESDMKKSLIAGIVLMALSAVAFGAVDINSASEMELSKVKGLHAKDAKSIIHYRDKHGNFKSVKDLEKVPGFSAKKVAKLSKELTVGETGTSAPAGAATAGTPAATKSNEQ